MTPRRSSATPRHRRRPLAFLAAGAVIAMALTVGPVATPAPVDAHAPTATCEPTTLFGEAVVAPDGTCQNGAAPSAKPGTRTQAAELAEVETLAPGFQDTFVFGGPGTPTNVRFAADGRAFVTEKSGSIRVYDSTTDPTPTVFDGLRTNVDDYWDRGMLGLALDPSLVDTTLPSRPYIYVLYTYDHVLSDGPGVLPPRWNDTCPSPPGPTTDGCVVSGRLSRLHVTGTTIDGAEQVLIEDWCQQFPSHSVGSIVFGPDGYLYASAGEGASFNTVDWGQYGGTAGSPTPKNPCGDPPDDAMTAPTGEGGSLRSQDLRTSGDPVGLDGSIIRIDPVTGVGAPGNPFAASPDLNARRIIAYGLRNPFRMTLRPGTDELWLGDVGWSTTEEIDRIPDLNDATAEDFGWPCYEGLVHQGGYDGANLQICEDLYAAGSNAVEKPYHTYPHSREVVTGDGCPTGSSAIAGLAFYPATGGPFPAHYAGGLFMADHERHCIWFLPKGVDGQPDTDAIELFAGGPLHPVDLEVGPDGNLYYADFDDREIRKISPIPPDQTPTATIVATPTSGPAPLHVVFDGSGSVDPEGKALLYRWDLDGDGQADDSTIANPTFDYPAGGSVTVRLEVEDPAGHVGTATQTITVGVPHAPPVPVIDAPPVGTTWGVGDPEPISFSGSASDTEDGPLADAQLTWTLVLKHCPSNCHTHIIETFDGVASGSFAPPDHEYPSHLELTLTATDSDGMSASFTRSLEPRTVSLQFRTVPTGLSLSVDSASQTAPFSRTVIDGSVNTVSAPSTQVKGGVTYAFAGWSDGGAASHNVTGRSGLIFTATYAAVTNATTLSLGPTTDDGTMVGDSTTLRATLNAASAPNGGTLSILDDTTHAVLASAPVSAKTTTLDVVVVRPLGTSPFRARFVPAQPSDGASSATYGLKVSPAPRPATTMSTTTLFTNSTSVASSFSGSDPSLTYQCRLGSSAAWTTCTSPHTFTSPGSGTFQIQVRARRASGLADRTPATRSWIVDRTRPTVTALTRTFLAGSAITNGRITARLVWTGTDAASGVARYEVQQAVDGGAWTDATTPLTSPTWSRALTPNHTYAFRVRAVDKAGNTGTWAALTASRVSRVSEADPAIDYTGTWTTVTSPKFWSGAAKASSQKNATATIDTTARMLAWVARTAPDRGSASVYVNGVKVATVDLQTSSLQDQRVVWSMSWSTALPRTVRIVVSATAGHPRVDLDELVLGR